MGFPKDFLWGVSTSAYQIEGAAKEDGKGESIWDVFCREKGKIEEGNTGDVACDHYHQMKEDVARMASLGIRAYRFSVAWTRILPDGEGKVNQKGLQFYSDLVDECLKYKIRPFVTLFHWDYPQKLEMQGGWLNLKSSDWFAGYTKIIAEAFGDRVKDYITFNEPQCQLWLGYETGIHAPGLHYPPARLLTMAKNIALAHGKAVSVIRSAVKNADIGFAPTCGMAYFPEHETEGEIAAAGHMNAGLESPCGIFATSAFWNELLIRGKFHLDCEKIYPHEVPELTAKETAVIAQPLDFCGVNFYQGNAVCLDADGNGMLSPLQSGHPRTACGWNITPRGLYWTVRYLEEAYQLPVIVTENGLSCTDRVSPDGCVHDSNRIDYLSEHLAQLQRAADDGIPVKGYFTWSLLDNFEWNSGYRERFGLVYVDFANLARIPKDSFAWYRDFIRSSEQA